MNLELHHFFILVKPGGEVADLLSSIGMIEGSGNRHEGQGTSNRRFFFSNGALELLWVRDEIEAKSGPGQNMLLVERAKSNGGSPFGVIFNRKDNVETKVPFEGWKYKPDYFEPPWAFHVGENSSNIVEPLCVYMPFIEPGTSAPIPQDSKQNALFNAVSDVTVYIPSESLSNVMTEVSRADRLSIKKSNAHLVELTFNENKNKQRHDFRPDIPLIVYW